MSDSVKGDRALGPDDKDELGFSPVAKRIAVSVADDALSSGLVVGIEGPWGSGKSSLLSLVRKELQSLADQKQVSVIDFRPWLIGDRDSLVTNLLSEIRGSLENIPTNPGEEKIKYNEIIENIRKYAAALKPLGNLVESVGDGIGSIILKLTGKAMKVDWSNSSSRSDQLSSLKENLEHSLRECGHRVVIIIDDVDRLDPEEAIEVLRIVRSVADLPNVVYLLCYDIEILSEIINNHIKLKNNKAYLEKIIQLNVPVPSADHQKLRLWFLKELNKIEPVRGQEWATRLAEVINYGEVGYINTPRSVNRALDAIRFFWPHLKEEELDFADLVWIKLIKNHNINLYRWIEEYCSVVSTLVKNNALIDEFDLEQRIAKLYDSVPEGYFNDRKYRKHFSNMLHGLRYARNDSDPMFQISIDDIYVGAPNAVAGRRISSPDHFRFYFALDDASPPLTKYQVNFFLDATDKMPQMKTRSGI